MIISTWSIQGMGETVMKKVIGFLIWVKNKNGNYNRIENIDHYPITTVWRNSETFRLEHVEFKGKSGNIHFGS